MSGSQSTSIGEWRRPEHQVSREATGRVVVHDVDWCGPLRWWRNRDIAVAKEESSSIIEAKAW